MIGAAVRDFTPTPTLECSRNRRGRPADEALCMSWSYRGPDSIDDRTGGHERPTRRFKRLALATPVPRSLTPR